MGLGLTKEGNTSKPIFSVRGRLYRILDIIGQGGEATVYRCEDQTADQFAVKVFQFSNYRPNDQRRRIYNFTKEARLLKYLNKRSNHFVHLYDYGYNRKQNAGYMIMELGEGSLRHALIGPPISDSYRRAYWKDIVSTLKDLHDARVVHADIKPDNFIFVNGVLKLTDLGLAFQIDQLRRPIQDSKVGGTIDYMAPEAFYRRSGIKSDIWSAGVILYEMTYGRPPYFSIMDRDRKKAAISSMAPISFPPIHDQHLLNCMRLCLQHNSTFRPNAYELRMHPYTRQM